MKARAVVSEGRSHHRLAAYVAAALLAAPHLIALASSSEADLKKLEQELQRKKVEKALSTRRDSDTSVPAKVALIDPGASIRETPLRGMFELMSKAGLVQYATASGRYALRGKMYYVKGGSIELSPGKPWPALEAPATGAGEDDRAGIARRLKVDPSEVRDTQIPGIVEAGRDTDTVYVSRDGLFAWSGDIWDVTKSVNISERNRRRVRQRIAAEYLGLGYIQFKGQGNIGTVTVFSDPSSPWDRKFHSEIAGLNEAGITVNYLPYPRGGANSEAGKTVLAVWCASDPKAAFIQAWAGETVEPAACGMTSLVSRSLEFGSRLGVRGVPSILRDDGKLVAGYMPVGELVREVTAARLD